MLRGDKQERTGTPAATRKPATLYSSASPLVDPVSLLVSEWCSTPNFVTPLYVVVWFWKVGGARGGALTVALTAGRSAWRCIR